MRITRIRSELVNAEIVLAQSNGSAAEPAQAAAIVRAALSEPLRWIARNAGHDGDAMVEHVRSLPPGWGLNALTGDYGEMIPAGVIDAAEVTRSALQNAVSIAALLLTTEALVAEELVGSPERCWLPGSATLPRGCRGRPRRRGRRPRRRMRSPLPWRPHRLAMPARGREFAPRRNGGVTPGWYDSPSNMRVRLPPRRALEMVRAARRASRISRVSSSLGCGWPDRPSRPPRRCRWSPGRPRSTGSWRTPQRRWRSRGCGTP